MNGVIKIRLLNISYITLIGTIIMGTLIADDNKFVIVTASYNNKEWYRWSLDSVINQSYQNWRMIYTDDCSPDGTGNLVESYINEHGLNEKIKLIKNENRLGAMANQYNAIHSCVDKEIIIILDGDDALANNKVLQYLNNVYSDSSVWLTYGQFVEWPSGTLGFCAPMPHEIVQNNVFRYYGDIPSHLRSYYAWLFKSIKKEDLLLEGNFLPMCADMAAMIPMIEMARNNFKFIPDVLYLYNATNPLNDHKVSKALQRRCDLTIRSRARYEPLKESKIEKILNLKQRQ